MAKRNTYHYYRIYDDREQFNYIRTSLEEQELRKMLKQFEKKKSGLLQHRLFDFSERTRRQCGAY